MQLLRHDMVLFSSRIPICGSTPNDVGPVCVCIALKRKKCIFDLSEVDVLRELSRLLLTVVFKFPPILGVEAL